MPTQAAPRIAIAACAFAAPAAAGAAGAAAAAAAAAAASGRLLRRVQYLPAGAFRSGDTRPEDAPAWRLDAASAARVIERFDARATPW